MPDIHTFLSAIWPAYTAYLITVLSPGPANFAIMGTAIAQGRHAGLVIARGIFCGSLTWGVSAALGLAALLRTYAFALEIIKVVGGLYLIYLAWKAYRSARTADAALTGGDVRTNYTTRQLWLRGYAIHITNPKAIFGWLAIMSLGLPADAPPSMVLSMLGIFSTSSFVIFMGYALLFSTRHALRIYKSARRWIEGTMAIFYGVAGIKLLTSRI